MAEKLQMRTTWTNYLVLFAVKAVCTYIFPQQLIRASKGHMCNLGVPQDPKVIVIFMQTHKIIEYLKELDRF